MITKLSLSLQTVQPGGFVLARDTVKNRGSAKAGRSVMRHYLSTDKRKGASDTRLRGKRRVKALRPKKKNKGAAVVSVPATSARGHYFLIACADDTRKVRERKEKNNCKSTGLSVTNPPDTNPPTTTITGGPANGSRANTRTATFSFSSSEPGSTFTCNLDYSNQGPCTSPKSYSGLADGYHSFRVQATDPSGNQDPVGAYRSWQIDATAPDTKIASNPGAVTDKTTAQFQFTATAPDTTSAKFECRLDNASFSACTSPKSYSGLADAGHTFQVRAKDAAGNVDPTPAQFAWTIDRAPDTTITAKPAEATRSTSAAFRFSSNRAGSTFECKLDSAAFNACSSPKAYSGLSEGEHAFSVRAVFSGKRDPTPAVAPWRVDKTAPDTQIDDGRAPPDPSGDTSPTFEFQASESGSTFHCRLDSNAFASCESPKTFTGVPGGAHTFQVKATDAAGNVDATPDSRTWTINTSLPNDPPPLSVDTSTSVLDATKFLYSGAKPVQKGVAPGTISANRVIDIRGWVVDVDQKFVVGTKVTVRNHPEYGYTTTQADGGFDIVVNGGEPLDLVFEKTGYVISQAEVPTGWRDVIEIDPVTLVRLDTKKTTVDPNSTTQAYEVAQGSTETDADGARKATVLFPKGTDGTAILPDGSQQPLDQMTVRATEFTVGQGGDESMPRALPDNSGFTYAVDFTVDQAEAVDATQVKFDKPLVNYTENFIGAPVGSPVPTGYYDEKAGMWKPSDNGIVIKIISETGGSADVDVTGDGVPDTGDALKVDPDMPITDAERKQLADLYDPGKELWRVKITHFTPWDHNWPFGPPKDAERPKLKEFEWKDPNDPCRQAGGSFIACEKQTLGEELPVTGTPFSLTYQSDRVPGWKANQIIDIPITGAPLSNKLKGAELNISVAGQTINKRWDNPATWGGDPDLPDLTPNLTYHFEWNGLDAFGRPVQGRPVATITINYVYDFVYYEGNEEWEQSFAQFTDDNTQVHDGRYACANKAGGNPYVVQGRIIDWQKYNEWNDMVKRRHFYCGIWTSETVDRPLGAWDSAGTDGLGSWTLNAHHTYDPLEKVVHLGDGSQLRSEVIGPTVSTVAGLGTTLNGDNIDASDARFNYLGELAIGPDGSMYTWDHFEDWLFKIDPKGKIRKYAGVGGDYDYYAWDGIPQCDGRQATKAILGTVSSMAAAPDGSLYLAAYGKRWPVGFICKIAPNGVITRVAGFDWNADRYPPNGDGGPATSAKLVDPQSLTVGPDGSIYFAERDGSPNGYHNTVRKIAPNGIVSTIIGGGTNKSDDDLTTGIPARDAQLNIIYGIAVAPDGSIYIADPTNHLVQRVGTDGILRRFAGKRSGGRERPGRPRPLGGRR